MSELYIPGGLTREQYDAIYNAIVTGMTISDAYIYAGLSPHTITVLEKDEEFQIKIAQLNKSLEYSLLDRMNRIAEKQERIGRNDATVWMLEKLFPRYASKPTSALPDIHINVPSQAFDPSTVQVSTPKKD